jgi:hypothetical protein
VDGSFCEGPLIKQLADGAEHQGGNPDYTYKYEIQNDRHIFTLKNISNGNVSTVEKTLDAQGNLVAHGSDGNHEVFQRDPIN